MWMHLQTVAWQEPKVFAMTSAGMPFAVITTACRTRRVYGLSALAASLASSSTVKPCIFVILIRGIGTLHLSSPLVSILPAREGKTYREVLTIALVIYSLTIWSMANSDAPLGQVRKLPNLLVTPRRTDENFLANDTHASRFFSIFSPRK